MRSLTCRVVPQTEGAFLYTYDPFWGQAQEVQLVNEMEFTYDIDVGTR